MAGELILIVEDEEMVRLQAEAALKQSGYHTLVAASGREALTQLETGSPDLMLSDIRMSDLDGLQLFSRARNIQPDLIGVFMTAYASTDIIVRAMQLGVSGFLIKPFTASELHRAIEDALEKSRNNQEAARLRVLAPLFEARRFLNAEFDLTGLGQAVVEVVAKETKSDYCAIFLPDDLDSQTLEASLKTVASFAGPDTQSFSPRSFPAVRLAGRTLELGRTLSLRRTTDQLPGTAEQVPGAVIGVPFFIGGRARGTLLIGRAEADKTFSQGERELFEVLAAQLATLIENRHLHATLAERNQRLRLFAGRFVSAYEEENRKLAERIQAELLPSLTTTRKGIQAYLQKVRPTAATELHQAEERLHNLINQTKKLVDDIQPSNLHEFGLTAALRKLINDWPTEPQSKAKPVFQLEGEEPPRLDSAIETALFRATQDSLDNASRHAAAKEIKVTVRTTGPRNKPNLLEIEIKDNGQGFDLTTFQTGDPTTRLGLMAIQERLTLVGADFQLQSTPGEGTTITISYKIPEDLYLIA